MSHSDRPPSIVGGFGDGAYGPTIFLKLESDAAVRWLHDLMLSMVNSTESRDLTSESIAQFRGIDRLELRSAFKAEKHLLRVRDRFSFLWCGSADYWRRTAGLLEPFLGGKTGHQYLTREGIDDAVLEVSFRESDVTA